MTSTPWNGNLKGVGGLKQKCPPSGGMDIFWNYTLANKSDILSHKKYYCLITAILAGSGIGNTYRDFRLDILRNTRI